MKMPRRPFFPGTLKPRPDIFGLHHLTILGAACECEADRKKRFATVEAGVLAAFKAAMSHLGEDQARVLFQRVLRRPKRGNSKTVAPNRDAILMKARDAAVENGESVAALSKRLHATYGIKLGNSAQAIQTQIRKLVRERDTRDREAKKQARFWRMATRGEAKTLAHGILIEK
jgi:hypothetical protein